MSEKKVRDELAVFQSYLRKGFLLFCKILPNADSAELREDVRRRIPEI
jgi:hypothetical protein